MKFTKTYAKGIFSIWKDDSAVFKGAMTVGQLEAHLLHAGFSMADAITIIMALAMAGANIHD